MRLTRLARSETASLPNWWFCRRTHTGKESWMANVEQTLMKVQRMVTGGMQLRAMLTGTGLQVSFADLSTVANIEVHEFGTDDDGEARSVVQVWSPILYNVPATPAVFEWVARNGGSRGFGRIELIDEDTAGRVMLVYSHTLLGDYLDEPELQLALFAVLGTADKWDDELQQRFGGKRWVDA